MVQLYNLIMFVFVPSQTTSSHSTVLANTSLHTGRVSDSDSERGSTMDAFESNVSEGRFGPRPKGRVRSLFDLGGGAASRADASFHEPHRVPAPKRQAAVDVFGEGGGMQGAWNNRRFEGAFEGRGQRLGASTGDINVMPSVFEISRGQVLGGDDGRKNFSTSGAGSVSTRGSGVARSGAAADVPADPRMQGVRGAAADLRMQMVGRPDENLPRRPNERAAEQVYETEWESAGIRRPWGRRARPYDLLGGGGN